MEEKVNKGAGAAATYVKHLSVHYHTSFICLVIFYSQEPHKEIIISISQWNNSTENFYTQ